MKKYLVLVIYKNKMSFVNIFKAKDYRALEKRVLKEYYDNIDDVHHYECVQITRAIMHDGYFMCGGYCGVKRGNGYTDKLLKEIEEEIRKEQNNG